jgi:hypothetical protein
MKKIETRNSAVIAAFRREISLSEKKVVSKKMYSRSEERNTIRLALA